MQNNDDVRKAFALSAEFLSHKNYHALTHAVLEYLESMAGITATASYELFVDSNKESEIAIRRFPVTLDEGFFDRNTDLIREAIRSSEGGIKCIAHAGQSYIFLDVVEGVIPRRVILITGQVDENDFTIVEGIFGIYSNQVALLDSKERDILTGLPNRQTLEFSLNEVVNFHLNNHNSEINPSWMVVLDIDHFKKINDTFGHVFGDEVFIHFADLMKTSFRHTDFLFRYGGEEFVIILNNSTAEQAQACLERFHEETQSYDFPSGKVTISIGYTQIVPTTAPTIHFEQADRALYEAKRNGRNQIVNFKDMQTQYQTKEDDIELF